MLEKLGLPAKPAARGSAWVVDASHCQSCCSAFSLFNRKHHCRRCGGLFCGDCVQSRMYLRGQGDAPVRICEPCKKIEEAARFEARYGRNKHKKDSATPELGSLLNNDSDVASVSGTDDSPQVSSEKLRERAEEERSRYTALKKEGKKDDAMKAFKRSRELERRAEALETSIRKSNKVAERAARPAAVKEKPLVNEQEDFASALKELGWADDIEKQNEDEAVILGLEEGSDRRASGKSAGTTGTGKSGALHMEILGHKRTALALKREGKLTEAKEELKKAKILEKRMEEVEMLGVEDESEEDDGDEVAALLRTFEKEISSGSTATTSKKVQPDMDHLPNLDDEKAVDITDDDMTDPDMIAALKAMGWEEEASALEEKSPSAQVEELKTRIQAHKRKALEFKRSGNLEEAKKELKQAKSLEQMLEAANVPEDSVDQEDMQDPLMLAALKAMGFESGDADLAAELRVKPEDRRALQQEILSIKRSALVLKRQGDTRGASLQLERAKALEIKLREQEQKQLLHSPEVDRDGYEDVFASDDPELAAILKGLDIGKTPSPTKVEPTSKGPASTSKSRGPTVPVPQKSKRELQGEILGIKRKALFLRREGKVDEANKELEQVKVLEMQLQALEEPQVVEEPDVGDENENEDAEVTEEDMMDPTLLAALSALGFKDEPAMQTKTDEQKTKASAASANAAVAAAAANAAASAAAANAAAATHSDAGFREDGEIGFSVDIAAPLLSHVGVRRRGREAPIGATEASVRGSMVDLLTGDDWKPDVQTSTAIQELKIGDATVQRTTVEKTTAEPAEVASKSCQTPPVVTSPAERSKDMQPESKSEALVQPDVVKQAMGLAETSKGQQPESRLEGPDLVTSPANISKGQQPEGPVQGDVAEQVMAHKRRALALKRQGDLVAAREELRKAKMLETTAMEAAGASGTRGQGEQQQQLGRKQTEQKHQVAQAGKNSSKDQEEPWQQLPLKVQLKGREQEPEFQNPSKYTSKDRIKLQQQSLGHKRRAMALRREGKVDEAEAEYEKAKLIERQLEEAQPAASSGQVVEDVLDPELLAALASVGLKEDAGVQSTRVVVKVDKKEHAVAETSRQEKVKALKLRALELKRAGKRREALEALQEAKKLEGL